VREGGGSEKGKVPMADRPSVADTEERKDRRKRGKKKRKGGKWEVSYSSGWLASYR